MLVENFYQPNTNAEKKEAKKREPPKFNVEEYMLETYVNLHLNRKLDSLSIVKGFCLGVSPFLVGTGLITNNVMLFQLGSAAITPVIANVCTDKYGYDANGNKLNSSGKPKNPPDADDLPDHDITTDDLKPGPCDQHSTYGQAGE